MVKPGMRLRFTIKRARQSRVAFADSAPEQPIRGTSVCRVLGFVSRSAVEFCLRWPYADRIHSFEGTP
jgi:hypothetical protein